MKKLFLVLGLIAITASCTPEENDSNYDNGKVEIEKDEIKDDDI